MYVRPGAAGRRRRGTGAIAGVGFRVGVAAGYAGFAARVVFRVTDRLEPLAALVAADGLGVGGLLVGPFSLAGGVVFAVGLELLRPDERPAPLLRSATAGVALAVAGWLFPVGIGLPLWMRVGIGTRLPVPSLPWDGLAGFVAYGAVFGAIYPTVREAFVRRSENAGMTVASVRRRLRAGRSRRHSAVGEATTRNASTVTNATGGHVQPTIKPRDDLGGCGCLGCRNTETTAPAGRSSTSCCGPFASFGRTRRS